MAPKPDCRWQVKQDKEVLFKDDRTLADEKKPLMRENERALKGPSAVQNGEMQEITQGLEELCKVRHDGGDGGGAGRGPKDSTGRDVTCITAGSRASPSPPRIAAANAIGAPSARDHGAAGVAGAGYAGFTGSGSSRDRGASSGLDDMDEGWESSESEGLLSEATRPASSHTTERLSGAAGPGAGKQEHEVAGVGAHEPGRMAVLDVHQDALDVAFRPETALPLVCPARDDSGTDSFDLTMDDGSPRFRMARGI